MGNAYFTNYSITKNSNDDYTIRLELEGTNFQSESFVVQQDAHPWFNSGESRSVVLTASSANWAINYVGYGSSCKLTFRCKASKSSTWQDVITVYTPDEYSSERYPSFYPEVTHQYIRDDSDGYKYEARTCVANAIATLKEIHEYKEGRTRYNRFSIGWIYGNRDSNHHQGEGMFVSEALDKLIQDGTPPFELLPENVDYFLPHVPMQDYYPDIYEYNYSDYTGFTAKQLVQNNYNSILKFAQPQRIKNHSGYIHKIDAKIYDIKQRVINDGGVLVELNLYNEFYSANNNGGIVPEYFSGEIVDGHAMIIMGWKKINGVSYWICQNSWGDWIGDNGIYYLPFWTNKATWYYYVEDNVYPLPKAPTPSLDINSTVKTGNSIKVTINPVEHVETYYARINGGNQQSSSGRTFTFTGLAPNTQYFIEIACIGSFYSMSDWAGYYVTTQSPATNATLTFSNITANSVRATLSGLDPNYPEYLRVVWFRGGTQIGIDEPVVTSSSINITGLSPNTSYLIRAEIYDTETHEFLDYLQKSVTTLSLPKLPTPTLDTTQTVKTGNSISVTINPVTGATTYYARINGGTAQSSTGRTFTFSGLQPNTQYFIEIKVGGTGYEDSNWAGYYATTLAAELWEWHYPKTSGSGFNVTPAEWLAFCNKINEVRVAKGLSAYSFTTSTTYIDKDKPFYAWIWLEAANAINQINGQVASACLNVNSGDIIYPWYFDNLKTALNNAISS